MTFADDRQELIELIGGVIAPYRRPITVSKTIQRGCRRFKAMCEEHYFYTALKIHFDTNHPFLQCNPLTSYKSLYFYISVIILKIFSPAPSLDNRRLCRLLFCSFVHRKVKSVVTYFISTCTVLFWIYKLACLLGVKYKLTWIVKIPC